MAKDLSFKERFPEWWKDELIDSLNGLVEDFEWEYIEKILSNRIEQPVQIWKEIITENEPIIVQNKYNKLDNQIIDLPNSIYKTKGKILINIEKGHEDNYITGIKIQNKDKTIYLDNLRSKCDKIEYDLESQAIYLDNILIQDNLPLVYFEDEYDEDSESIFKNKTELKISINEKIIGNKNNTYNLIIEMDNPVFMIEQNIKLSSLAFLPLKSVELYGLYDLKYNPNQNGWKFLVEKRYDKEEHIVFDKLTFQYPVEKFYVNVSFYGVDKILTKGFPQYAEHEEEKYLINTYLDEKAAELGLIRREYKKEIPYEELHKTFPPYYEYDIEQDYWFERRLLSEYVYDDQKINTALLKDDEDTSLIRLYCKDPFLEELVILADTKEPNYDLYFTESEKVLPYKVEQINQNKNKEWKYIDNIKNDNDSFASTSLDIKKGENITNESYKSNILKSYFDFSFLPDNIKIEGIEFEIDTRSMDSYITKRDDERTKLILKNTQKLEIFENNITPDQIPNSIETEYYNQENEYEFEYNEDVIINTFFEDAKYDQVDVYVNNIFKQEYNVTSDVIIPYNLGKLEPGVYTYYILINYKGDETTNGKQLLNKATITIKNPNIEIPAQQAEIWTKKRKLLRYGGKLDLFGEYQILPEQIINDIFSFQIGIENDDLLDGSIIDIFNIKARIYYRKILPMFTVQTFIKEQKILENEETELKIIIKNIGQIPISDKKINIIGPNGIEITQPTLNIYDILPNEEKEYIVNIKGLKIGIWIIYTFVDNQIKTNSLKVIKDE